MTDIVQRPELAVNPVTGELLTLADTTTDVLAEHYQALTVFEDEGIRAFKRAVADELLARMDREGAWTAHVGKWDISGDSPDRKEYGERVRHDFEDGTALLADLNALVEQDVITRDAVERAIETLTVHKVRRKGINALLKIPAAREVIEKHERQSAKPRYVRVKQEATR